MARLVFYDFQQLFQWKYFLLGSIIFGFIGWQRTEVALAFSTSPSLWDCIFVSLSGPSASDLVLFDFVNWFVIHLFFLFLVSRFLQINFSTFNTILFPRLGSRYRWLLSYFVFIALFSVIYTSVVIGLTALGALLQLSTSGLIPLLGSSTFWGNTSIPQSGILIGWFWALTSGALLLATLIELLLMGFFRSVMYSFMVVIFLYLAAWLSASNNGLQMILPPAQSMLIRHAIFNTDNSAFTFEYSLCYVILITFVMLALIARQIRYLDIFNEA
jgi:hypothetical protein